jgi:hypothetical protein
MKLTGRIEFTERYYEPPTDEEFEQADKAALDPPEGTYKYRRINPLLSQIRYPAEYPGKSKHCILVMDDWTEVVIRGKYDDICILLEDRERMYNEGHDEIEGHQE